MHYMVQTMSFESLFLFEKALADYTGAPYVVVTDGCTNAIELCMRYDQIQECKFTPYTYLSIPMLMHKLQIKYQYIDHAWQRWVGEYPFLETRIWDSARRLEPGMYRPGQFQCLSFGNTKPLQLGRVGAILLDDEQAYKKLSVMRSDGRDLQISPWPSQQVFELGFHFTPSLELCSQGIKQLPYVDPVPKFVEYNDCRKIVIRS
jgi:dTDP-4-amino-4,6-dideoxygalactose transaminase